MDLLSDTYILIHTFFPSSLINLMFMFIVSLVTDIFIGNQLQLHLKIHYFVVVVKESEVKLKHLTPSESREVSVSVAFCVLYS